MPKHWQNTMQISQNISNNAHEINTRYYLTRSRRKGIDIITIMCEYIKRKLYFVVAWYFRFWAQYKLKKWDPQIIVITGSSGKTTLMHFIESQLKSEAKFSHHANSSIGIPFDILGIQRHSLKPREWGKIILQAPIKACAKEVPKEKIYVAECDCDRPGEGKFLAQFLKPDITLWVTCARTHTVNFDHLVGKKNFTTVEDAVAFEFGYFIEYTTGCVIYDKDNELIKKQLHRTKAQKKIGVTLDNMQVYFLGPNGTTFRINHKQYTFKSLHPKEIANTIQMTLELMRYLNIEPDEIFSNLQLPPGRTTVYKGVKNTRLIDSSYNANYISMKAILNMFEKMTADVKWVVLGDMKELGAETQEEHEKLGEIVKNMHLDKIILIGALVRKYTYPYLRALHKNNLNIISCETHREALDYIQRHIQGKETILFKASQSMVFEGIIEHLLANQNDIKTLPRREQFWIEYRRKKGI